ncbi:hypothetical protein JCM21714_3438 [Gracilibacillus boraciitolerans JCM 21714]|uniref:Uncharacterized protein n=1 Tax=Gracilibacillus boraciitolerans JCM 21714 TaxID=1298598 RepID=W4VM56_9BACI|nr:hypothetical protein [Gracilibacillus boraciitolerans]GAE94292.1 hypothetical protein JCM21714_3438 [Gracilibacillus boraciitolerans JCM 21714]
MSKSVNISYEKARKLFIKIAFLLNQVHLQCKVPTASKESINLYTPEKLFKYSEQIGTIQYKGIQYPQHEDNELKLKGIELRLDGEFLKALNIYDKMKKFMVKEDADGWLKHKLLLKNKEIKRVRKITSLLAKGMEKKFGLDYLSFSMDKSMLELPKIQNSPVNKYDQEIAVQHVSDILVSDGFKVTRSSNSNSSYHISVLIRGGESVKCRVKHLKYDNAYKASPLPYQVYKIDAFKTFEEQKKKISDVDVIVGYNIHDSAFACLDKKQFEDKKSRVVHAKEGQNSNYFKTWKALQEFNRL